MNKTWYNNKYLLKQGPFGNPEHGNRLLLEYMYSVLQTGIQSATCLHNPAVSRETLQTFSLQC